MDYSDYFSGIQSQIDSALNSYQEQINGAIGSYEAAIGNYIQSYQDSLGQMLTAPDPFDQSAAYMDILRQQSNLNNSWSAEQAQKQMDFQERMSSTAIQRQMADLKAAGLNPVLSAKLGGASTPSGASATADTAIVSAMANIMDKLIDYQQTSALAGIAMGSGSGYGSGYYGSEDAGYVDPKTAGQMAQSIGLPYWLGSVGANMINGYNGVTIKRGESNGLAWKVGNAAGAASPATNAASKAYHENTKYAFANANQGLQNSPIVKAGAKLVSGIAKQITSSGAAKINVSGKGLH